MSILHIGGLSLKKWITAALALQQLLSVDPSHKGGGSCIIKLGLR